jgi:hypothetical protein
LAKVDPLLAWKLGIALHEANAIESYTFESAIHEVITPQYLSQIDSAQIQKLLDGEPRLAEAISYAFREMQDPRAVPWLGQCLANPDVTVQYNGMMGLYEVCGKKEGFFTPFIALFKTDPPKYLAPYQAWWAQHRAEYFTVAQ